MNKKVSPKTTPTKMGDGKGGIFSIDEQSMQANSADGISSLLLTIAVMLGAAVAMLFMLFLMQMDWTRQTQSLTLEVEQIAGRGDHAAGFERDFDPPGADEVEQLTEPAMEQTIQMVTDAISSIAASMDTITSATSLSGEGTGKGDSRPPGPEGEGVDGVHRGERWELKFSARDRKAYATQLEAFGIELAAIGGGIATIDYASNLGKTPTPRSGTRDQEKRLFFTYVTNNALMQYDKALLQAAGVNIRDRTILKFTRRTSKILWRWLKRPIIWKNEARTSAFPILPRRSLNAVRARVANSNGSSSINATETRIPR